MNCKTPFQFLLTLLSFISVQGWYWISIGSYQYNYISDDSYYDNYVNLIAGRNYSIVVLGLNGYNSTVTVTDSSGYSAFNNDYGGSYSSSSYSYAGSSALTFTPNASGLTQIRTGSGDGAGYTYTYVLDITPCPASCTSCYTWTACVVCPMSYRCDACSGTDEYRYGSACTKNCPSGTYADSSVCKVCGYYMDSYYCTTCNSTNCLSCFYSFYVAEAKTCSTSCYSGYNNNGLCTSCLGVTTVENCRACSSSGTCTGCVSGWYLYSSNQTCLTSCPTGYYGSDYYGYCYSCYSYCSSCNSSVCFSCTSGRTPQGWYCVSTCSSGYFNNTALGVCSLCSLVNSNCSTCSNSTTCTTCTTSSGRYAWGADCLESCPAGTFYSGTACVTSCPSTTYNNGTHCIACTTLDSYCSACSDSKTCTTCSSSRYIYGATCLTSCPSTTYKNSNGVCIECSTLDSSCTACNSSITCTACSSGYALGATCIASCQTGTYDKSGVCTSCATFSDGCTACTSSGCSTCTSGLFVSGTICVSSCSSTTYNNGTNCIACTTLDSSCTSCNSSTTCTGCSSTSFYAYGAVCQSSCPSGTFINNSICTSCATLNSACTACNASTTCTTCSSGYASGATCVSSCPSGTYNNNSAGACQSCLNINPYCSTCSNSTTCESCLYGYYAFGTTCLSSCPSTTYTESGKCHNCTNLDQYCTSCVSSRSCTSCSNSRYVYGATCVTSCPQGTANNGGVCTAVSLKVSLSNTDSVNNYNVEITSALVYDIDVVAVSKVILVGIDPSAYTYTLTKQSDTVYLISIQYTQTITATTLKFVYSLTGYPSTKNSNIGDWSDQIASKYMAYISEGAKKAVEAVNSVAGGSMQGASVGASSMAVLGGNPALLWTLMNLFQQFYYLSFIDVNFPANVQMFLEIFSMGSLSFIPNPLEWFVSDIDAYSLPVPQRYNDQSFSGLFLDNAGNELLLLFFIFLIFCICKVMKKWLRRLPVSIRFASNKTIGWFQWSGIMESLITSYTDITQAVFLQLKVLTFTSTVFVLSSVLCFVTLGFVVAFPVLIILIIRKYSDHPELLTIQYETLVGDYNIDKVAARNYVPIWLLRRLIMCLSLVFLQGSPYVQINVLSILQIAGIYYCWVYTPYTTRKENICNTLMEILFGGIHVVIYILIYDDHNPYFSDDQRLQLGWIIIFCCGAILLLSLGLSLFEQVRMIIRGLRMLKQLMSKKDKIKKGKSSKPKPRIEDSIQTDQSTLVDLNRTQTDASPFSSPVLRPAVRVNPPPRSLAIEKNLRRARIASRIRELRAMNS